MKMAPKWLLIFDLVMGDQLNCFSVQPFWRLINPLKIPYDYEQLPGHIAKCPAGSNCLSRKDPTLKFLYNPACMIEGSWGTANLAFIEKNTRRGK